MNPLDLTSQLRAFLRKPLPAPNHPPCECGEPIAYWQGEESRTYACALCHEAESQAERKPTHDHISHVGQFAGVRYCGATDGTSCHLPYVANAMTWAAEHIACAECRQILAEAEAE